uniref:Uncharacterized protein n=1 Tax=Arundo donax TaxID=35708 RepID=A0A0A8Y0M4_ARUDO
MERGEERKGSGTSEEGEEGEVIGGVDAAECGENPERERRRGG